MDTFIKNILLIFLVILPAPLLAANNYTLETLWSGVVAPGKPLSATIIMHDASGEPIAENQLKDRNKHKIHLWLIDTSFTDLQHLHPQATTSPYTFNFTFTPKVNNSYVVWADINPYTPDQRILMSGWMGDKEHAFIDHEESLITIMGGYNFTLSFNVPPKVGEPSVATIHVADSAGSPVKWPTQPMVQSNKEFFGIIGFYQDNEHVIHAYQDVPNGFVDDFEGPDVKFNITPPKAGYVKMFLQATINGKEMLVPFAFLVTN